MFLAFYRNSVDVPDVSKQSSDRSPAAAAAAAEWRDQQHSQHPQHVWWDDGSCYTAPEQARPPKPINTSVSGQKGYTVLAYKATWYVMEQSETITTAVTSLYILVLLLCFITFTSPMHPHSRLQSWPDIPLYSTIGKCVFLQLPHLKALSCKTALSYIYLAYFT